MTLLALIGLAACNGTTGVSTVDLRSTDGGAARSTPTDAAAVSDALEPGMGGLRGSMAGAPAIWPDEPLEIFAAPFYSDGSGAGFYILEPSLHSHGALDEKGNFVLADIPPGDFVLVAGPDPEQALPALDGQGSPLIVQVQADQWKDLGLLSLGE